MGSDERCQCQRLFETFGGFAQGAKAFEARLLLLERFHEIGTLAGGGLGNERLAFFTFEREENLEIGSQTIREVAKSVCGNRREEQRGSLAVCWQTGVQKARELVPASRSEAGFDHLGFD